ncbi:hypothetical protein [Emticicia sp. 21SJ11W-3]|uniref:hypothetical protein n=1 Tax=Emticicia sp. 21SJ11W-3 TaxID=2916755 RepID=UPI00209FA760|nr:hypothetical protein [Emticicia sp. 21SJ11W-3]UTA67722.1 hypothetical protein MB380_19300 [Emticicia sp. 21SJ11W-3]
MTTNQQIDRIINVLFDRQVRKQADFTGVPAYNELCRELFAELPGMNEQQFRNLLFILVSKKIVNIHSNTLSDAYSEPVSLTPETIAWYEQFRSYLAYLDYMQEKHRPIIADEDDEPDVDEKSPGRVWLPAWAKIVILVAAVIAVWVMFYRN